MWYRPPRRVKTAPLEEGKGEGVEGRDSQVNKGAGGREGDMSDG